MDDFDRKMSQKERELRLNKSYSGRFNWLAENTKFDDTRLILNSIMCAIAEELTLLEARLMEEIRNAKS